MRRLKHSVLKSTAARNGLRLLHRTTTGARVLNHFAHPRCVFPSMAKALEACQAMNSAAHIDPVLMESNFDLSLQRRLSDYPVLFWLQRIAENKALRIFDFGGGLGQTYYHYSEALAPESISQWTILELPELIERGLERAAELGTVNLSFTSRLSDCATHNVFLASGAFHYWERGISQLDRETGGLPEHILINRSPIRDDGDPYITIQAPGPWRVPCMVRTKGQLVREFETIGYKLVADWHTPEKTLVLPLFPDHTAPYMGMYFRRFVPTSQD